MKQTVNECKEKNSSKNILTNRVADRVTKTGTAFIVKSQMLVQ